MAFTPEQLEEYRKWLEENKSPEELDEDVRRAKLIEAEELARAEKVASKPISTLGESAPSLRDVKISEKIPPGPGQRLGKRALEEYVKARSIPGKTAERSAGVFNEVPKLPSEIEADKTEAREAARRLSQQQKAEKRTLEEYVEAQSTPSKTAREAAETLIPKRYAEPTLSTTAKTASLDLGETTDKLPQIQYQYIKPAAPTMEEIAEAQRKLNSGSSPSIGSKLGKGVGALGLAADVAQGDALGAAIDAAGYVGKFAKFAPALDLLRPTDTASNELSEKDKILGERARGEYLKSLGVNEADLGYLSAVSASPIGRILNETKIRDPRELTSSGQAELLSEAKAKVGTSDSTPSFFPFKSEEDKKLALADLSRPKTPGRSVGSVKASGTKGTQESSIASEANKELTREKEEIDFLSLLEQAKQSRDRQQLLANLGRAGETLSSAIGGMVRGGAVTKPTGTEFYKDLAKQAEKYVEDVGDQFKFKSAQEEKDRLSQRRDPNSEESKFARDLLKQQGITIPEAATAETLEKYAPWITNLYNQKENREARKQELQIRMAEIASRKDLSTDQKQEAFIQSLRKETTSGALGKMFNNFSTTKKITKALSEFEKDPSGYTDYATLLGGLKALQGDESVVKEAEIRLGMNAASLADQVNNWTDRLISGRSLQPDQVKQIIKSVRILSGVARNQYKEAIQPIMNQAQSLGIDTKKLVGEGLLDDSLQPSAKKDPEIQKYADQHFNGIYEAAEEHFKNKGVL